MIDIHIRPWIKINGHLNKKILDQLLISLLNFCMTNPGATLTKIANHIQPALQPFHTRELIEMLDKLGMHYFEYFLITPTKTIYQC